MKHALFRFPATAPDSLPQLRRLLSGAGRPDYYPDYGAGLWGVTWTGSPSDLVQKLSWIAVYFDGFVYGWVRFCHHVPGGPRRTKDPAVKGDGDLLMTDRYIRFAKPLAFTPWSNRSCYLQDYEVVNMPPPDPDDGDPVVWVQDEKLIHGCSEHPDP